MLALLALLLLPGLLVVRAPWATVPFLSLFFWIASWWWLPSLARGRLLTAALAGFALTSLLRLMRLDAARPSWPALLALATATLSGAAAFGPAIDSPGAPLDATAARLMVWHDSLPRTYMPLREAGSFPAHAHGFDAVAADLSLLAKIDVPLAVGLAAAAARGLWSLGLFVLLSRLFAPGPGAIGAAGASLAASLLEAALGPADPASSLALAFVFAAVGLLARGHTRAGAVAAGVLAGTAVMAGPLVAGAGMAAAAGGAAVAWRHFPPAERERRGRRMVIAATGLVVTTVPYLLRVAIALARN
jgi:hypothetical protein